MRRCCIKSKAKFRWIGGFFLYILREKQKRVQWTRTVRVVEREFKQKRGDKNDDVKSVLKDGPGMKYESVVS